MAESWQDYLNGLVLEIFNARRGTKNLDDHYKTIYLCYPPNLVALMFYLRDIKNGRGEKDLSYDIAIWLLNHDEGLFLKHYPTLITFGYYKDCLNLAQIAIKQNYPEDKIFKLLAPMATALTEDEHTITQMTFKCSNNSSARPKLSLAAKYAPRQGKAYANTIPYLKKLCNIAGKKSDEKWRKYIQYIARSCADVPVETHLSQSDLLVDVVVPHKASKLYGMACTSNNDKNIAKITTSKVITTNKVITTKTLFDQETPIGTFRTQIKWNQMLYDHIIQKTAKTYIPAIDLSAVMLHDNARPLNTAMTVGNLMSSSNLNIFYKKMITYSNDATLVNIVGDSIHDKINSVFSAFDDITDTIENSKLDQVLKLNYVNMLRNLLQFYLSNDIPMDILNDVNVVVLSCTEPRLSEEEKNTINQVYSKFVEFGYPIPNIVHWNLADTTTYATKSIYGIKCISGFNQKMFEHFLQNDSLEVDEIPFKLLNWYKDLLA
jgi:hypothetical protein